MIVMDGVSKSYPSKGGRRAVLSNASMTFEPGCNTAIIGPNGAGKSTLMRLLSGAEMPDSGRVTCTSQISWPMGFAGGLHGSLNGRENVAFIARVYDRDYREMLDFVEDFAEIGSAMLNPIRTYSAGMRARVAFGMSMAIKFDFYLIDEVIGVGDAAFRKKCGDVLSDRLKDATIIMVSHSAGIMREFCDQGCVLQNGKLLPFSDIGDALVHYDAVFVKKTKSMTDPV